MSEILIIAEQRRGSLAPVSLELVGAAQSVRRPGDTVVVALIAAEPERLVDPLAVQGVDCLVLVPVSAREFDPDTFESAVQALVQARRPALVLLPHSIDAFSYAPALAARHGWGFATDVFRLERQSAELVATRPAYGQKVNVELGFPGRDVVLLALRANTFKPPEPAGSPAPVERFDAPAIEPRVQSRDFIEPVAADDVDMTAAEFILAIGRGVGEQANVEQFQELADAIGATLGCSRPIADAGWLPKSRQVGQSGKTASACKLYIAMGISGAIQHLAGMKHIGTIVAVNQDAGAAIFATAHYGVVGDIFDFAEALREQF